MLCVYVMSGTYSPQYGVCILCMVSADTRAGRLRWRTDILFIGIKYAVRLRCRTDKCWWQSILAGGGGGGGEKFNQRSGRWISRISGATCKP